MAPVPSCIGDFSVLPITIPPLPAYPVSVTHYIYLRRNAPKISTENDARSLFLTNLPVDSTEAHLRALFATLVGVGRFESITFEDDKRNTQTSLIQPGQAARLLAHSKKRKREDEEIKHLEEEVAAKLPDIWSRRLHKSGGSAVVLLADEKSVDSVLKAVGKLHKSKKFPVWGENVSEKTPALGSQWLKSHNKLSYPGTAAVQHAVDAYFTVFNRKEEEAAQLAKRLRNEPDEDGFVTVTRGGRNNPARTAEAEEARRRMLEKEQKKKDNMKDFYRFQLRERKKLEQAELLKRFEEDRKKVNAMRQQRGKFRPET